MGSESHQINLNWYDHRRWWVIVSISGSIYQLQILFFTNATLLPATSSHQGYLCIYVDFFEGMTWESTIDLLKQELFCKLWIVFCSLIELVSDVGSNNWIAFHLKFLRRRIILILPLQAATAPKSDRLLSFNQTAWPKNMFDNYVW